MLRRFTSSNAARFGAPARTSGAAAAAATTTAVAVAGKRGYKYQEFEMSKDAQYVFYYPREVPNTSYFGQWFLGTFTWFGWGREDIWIEKEERRYETSWQRIRKYVMWIFPLWYVFPQGSFPLMSKQSYGDYGWKSYICEHLPCDHMYIEYGWQSLDAEYLRHIHTRDSY